MRRHFNSRFPGLDVKRLDETYATDTMFATVRAIDGSTCAQVYVGRTRTFCQVYGLKTEAEIVDAQKMAGAV